MNRSYEVMFIVRPDVVDEELDKLVSAIETSVGNAGGTVKATERMGKRRLAYTVRKFNEGMYVLLTVEGTGGTVAEIERRLRVTEPVIKFLTVRVDEEQKRLDKVKKLRASKVKRSTQPAQPAQPAAEPAAGEAPAAVNA
jgi:small subunit ribosomal protein S6